MAKLNPELSKLLEDLSEKLDPDNRNEDWQRTWLENQAREQKETLKCPECDAFVPMRPDTFDDDGQRICFICKIKFAEKEY